MKVEFLKHYGFMLGASVNSMPQDDYWIIWIWFGDRRLQLKFNKIRLKKENK